MTKPPPPSLEDYEAIAAAVMETERGRWFLEEFARRNRAADTAQILAALAQLETRMRLQPTPPAIEVRGDDALERRSHLIEGTAEVRPTPTLMLAAPAEIPPMEAEATARSSIDVTTLAVVPPLAEAPSGLDIAAQPETRSPPIAAPAWPRASDGMPPPRASSPLHETAQPRANVGAGASMSRTTPLLESLSEAEKALLFA